MSHHCWLHLQVQQSNINTNWENGKKKFILILLVIIRRSILEVIYSQLLYNPNTFTFLRSIFRYIAEEQQQQKSHSTQLENYCYYTHLRETAMGSHYRHVVMPLICTISSLLQWFPMFTLNFPSSHTITVADDNFLHIKYSANNNNNKIHCRSHRFSTQRLDFCCCWRWLRVFLFHVDFLFQ